MSIKDRVLQDIQDRGAEGLTAFEAVAETGQLPQTVYPCFTQLCKAGLILDSQIRRKSLKGRNCIVWVDQRHGGVVPVWQNGRPTYSYKGRTKQVMDRLWYGPQTVLELCTKLNLEQMSLSSLLARLREQKWVRTLPSKRKAHGQKSCLCFQLTPRGRQILEQSPKSRRK